MCDRTQRTRLKATLHLIKLLSRKAILGGVFVDPYQDTKWCEPFLLHYCNLKTSGCLFRKVTCAPTPWYRTPHQLPPSCHYTSSLPSNTALFTTIHILLNLYIQYTVCSTLCFQTQT